MPELPEIPMSCKPESQKQRLERIAVHVLAGLLANPDPQIVATGPRTMAEIAVGQATEFISVLDALPLDE
jgi:hypothetical protein